MRTLLLFWGVSLTLAAQTTSSKGWLDKSLSPDQRADLLIEQMTLDEKIQLVHGSGLAGFMRTPVDPALAVRFLGGAGFVLGVPRLGIPDLQMADSAVGVALGAAHSRYSTALPSALSNASTWDLKTAYDFGALIGRELRDQGYNMSLGGGVNITRDPRNGRNFEYNGEDPILAGKMDGQLMKGVQAQGVIGDIKHYALNDQETGRNIVNVIVSKRTMRETDLLAFEIAIRDSQTGAVMCSYNRVNGDYACENSYLLTDVLKKDWGFKGFVVSDWWAAHSTAKAALAGLDQEEPSNVDQNRAFFGEPLKKAVETGDVPLARLNEMVHRILRTEFAIGLFDNKYQTQVVDVFGGREFAQHVAEEGSVLLKNEHAQLPLKAVKSIAVIGSHADVGVISGGGSAQVDPPGGNAVPSKRQWGAAVWDPSSPLKAIRASARGAKVTYDPGTDPAAAASAAKSADVAIVFVNQPSSEGRDVSLTPPDNQDAVVSAVAAANPHTVVVLETGGPVLMPWIDNVNAVLESWFPGIGGGEAIAAILFGDVNPSAKLPVTFPKSEADLPRATIEKPPAGSRQQPMPGMGVPPINYQVDYNTDGLKVGYKWYEAEGKKPLFPFGFGLSYTTFSYSGLTVTSGKAIEVSFSVRNSGTRAGAEIAEVYAALPPSTGEPPKRLVAWEKVELAPGALKKVTLTADPEFLSIFNVDKDAWELVPGEYKILVGGSSADTPLTKEFKIQ
jgi:beta-glucosidase